MRGTPRLARKRSSRAGSARTVWVAPAALRPCSSMALKRSRPSGSRWTWWTTRMARGACCCMRSRRVSGETDEPHREEIAAVEGEVQEAGEVDQKGIGQVLGFVEDDEGRGAALIDQVQERLLEVGPERGAPVGRPHADLGREGGVEVERGPRGVAEVEHEVVGSRELRAEVADGGGLADAGVGGED